MIEFKWMVVILTFILSAFMMYWTGKGKDQDGEG
jgi:hypothetical protein